MRYRQRMAALVGVAGWAAMLAAPVAAQDADAEPQTEAEADADITDDDIEELDRIVIRGRGGNIDDAMAAFRRGDFATAELEFKENAACALRRERLRLAAIEDIQRDQARADLSGDGGAGTDVNVSGGGPGGQTSIAPGSAQPGVRPPPVAGQRPDGEQLGAEPTGDTCENRGFQIYMTGLSQLQLGKTEEALRSFEQATRINRTLYDAHYRVALMALLVGEEHEARGRLRAINRILSRCRDCEAREEIIARRDHLEKALAGEVPLE